MNNPVIVWARGFLRIVAVERSSPFESATRALIIEYKDRDTLGAPAWTPLDLQSMTMETRIAVYFLATFLADTSDIHPKWVRDFLKTDLEKYMSVDALHECDDVDEDEEEDEKDDDGEDLPS